MDLVPTGRAELVFMVNVRQTEKRMRVPSTDDLCMLGERSRVTHLIGNNLWTKTKVHCGGQRSDDGRHEPTELVVHQELWTVL